MASMYSDNTIPLHHDLRKSSSGKRKTLCIALILLVVAVVVIVPTVVVVTRKDKKSSGGEDGENFTPDLSFPSDVTCKVLENAPPNNGSGPIGTVNVTKVVLLQGLEVPWQLAYEPGKTTMFMTERAGRLSQFDSGATAQASLKVLANVPDVASATYTVEGGLLGLAVDFDSSPVYIYLYVTSGEGGNYRNRVERWIYNKIEQSVTKDKIILDGIPSAKVNNGGFLLLKGGHLYIGTGDAERPRSAQDVDSMAGKILRINTDGTFPADNPYPNNPVFMSGFKNPAGFSFLSNDTLIIADHGEGGLEKGGDRVLVGTKGANMGWGKTINCQTNKPGESAIIAPRLIYGAVNPPGGILVYSNPSTQESDATIAAWKDHVLLTSLRGRHLQDISLSPAPEYGFVDNAVYFKGSVTEGGMGRLRSIILNDRNGLFVGTSNCDSRGQDLGLCKNETKDVIYRILSV